MSMHDDNFNKQKGRLLKKSVQWIFVHVTCETGAFGARVLAYVLRNGPVLTPARLALIFISSV